jgi:hypothetical protein
MEFSDYWVSILYSFSLFCTILCLLLDSVAHMRSTCEGGLGSGPFPIFLNITRMKSHDSNSILVGCSTHISLPSVLHQGVETSGVGVNETCNTSSRSTLMCQRSVRRLKVHWRRPRRPDIVPWNGLDPCGIGRRPDSPNCAAGKIDIPLPADHSSNASPALEMCPVK